MKELVPTGTSQVFKGKPTPQWDGKHYWVVVVGHHVQDPTQFDDDNDEIAILDAESYIGTDGPFCEYCRTTYVHGIHEQPCGGRP